MVQLNDRTWIFGMISAVALVGCGPDDPGPQLEPLGPQGGATTIDNRTSHAFEKPAPNLSPAAMELHTDGDATFAAQFVSEPAERNPGLGPKFNNNSCNSCHIRNGRGMPRVGAKGLRSQMLIRVSDPDGEPVHPGGPPAIEGIGLQIQDHAIWEEEPEADVSITWKTVEGTYADGTSYELRRPDVEIEPTEPEKWPETFETSLRQPPPVHGLGLLEAVPAERIIARADPDDADGDGISGRVNRVWGATEQKSDVLGRFGHKANIPDLLHQTANAYRNDMGVTNPLFTTGEETIDIGQETLEASTHYAQTLAVPGRARVDDPQVKRGRRRFKEAGCVDCHVETMKTGSHEVAALENQTIHPYTDLLLHDMGEGLADGRSDYRATGSEWRTPPLWGIGVTQRVLPGAGYLHDGRARTLAEAILWHGGEAAESREAFRTMGDAERAELLAFLRAL